MTAPPPDPASRFLQIGRRRIHYADWGNDGAPVLIFQHGGQDHCRSWDWLAAAFRHDYHVIAPDLAGHGDSEWHNSGIYTSSTYVSDFAHIIDHLGAEKVSIAAHSLGGMMACRYAGIYPERVDRLMAIEGLSMAPRHLAKQAAIPMSERARKYFAALQDVATHTARLYPTIEDAARRMASQHPFLSAEQADHLTRHGVRRVEGGYVWKFDPYLRVFPLYDMRIEDLEQLWTQITCPMLHIYGAESGASNPLEDGRAQFLKDARFVTIPGAKHWVHHDHFADVLALAKEFFALPPLSTNNHHS